MASCGCCGWLVSIMMQALASMLVPRLQQQSPRAREGGVVVVSSPMVRAIRTIEPTVRALGLPPDRSSSSRLAAP